MNKGKRIREGMGLTRDTSGQLSIDFLAGVAIFLLAFIFIFAFVPGMFTPFKSNSDELTMTADRVSTALVENVLLVSNPPSLPTDRNINRPNVIDATKLSTTDFATEVGRESLGLSSNRVYNIHVTLTVNMASPNTVNYGQKYPTGALNVGQSKRIVVIANTCTLTDSEGNTIQINVPVDSTKSVMGILTVTVW